MSWLFTFIMLVLISDIIIGVFIGLAELPYDWFVSWSKDVEDYRLTSAPQWAENVINGVKLLVLWLYFIPTIYAISWGIKLKQEFV